jgi:hypothetical protein
MRRSGGGVPKSVGAGREGGDVSKALTIEDLNWIGMNGLSVFEITECGADFIGFKISVNETHGIARLSELQAESVCINLLKLIHDRRCKRQRFDAEVMPADGGNGK